MGRGVTPNFFDVLGVRPVMGRSFAPEDDRIGVNVVVISQALWQRRYGGSPDIVGRTILMNDAKYEVVGVRKYGETEQRLYLLNAWRESPLYTERERAALGWTEALTLISETHAPDEDYGAMRAQFSEAEAVNLTVLIGAINAWNRVAIGFRAVHPVAKKAAA
jgi:hypothetical protein